MKYLSNPFYLYILSFGSALLIYQLGWSDLYPVLTKQLIFFFLLTFIIAFISGLMLNRIRPARYEILNGGIEPFWVIGGIYILFIAEFCAYGGIPLIMTLIGHFDKNVHFGIKTLHPILVTFTSFYTVLIFHHYLSSREKKYLLTLVLLLLLPLLYFDRGGMLINLTSMVFVFFMSVGRIRMQSAFIISVTIIILLFGFGVLGNLRETKSISNEHFLNISKASDKFLGSNVPNEFLWSYMYITSPVANLQQNIDKADIDRKDVTSLLLTELTPDFISKRLSPMFGAKRAELNNISANFTVGTIFARAYVLMGWSGVYAIFMLNGLFMLVYLLVLKYNNPYYLTGICLICTYSIYNAFTNMIYFSGMSFQLIYPLLLGYIYSYRNRLLL